MTKQLSSSAPGGIFSATGSLCCALQHQCGLGGWVPAHSLETPAPGGGPLSITELPSLPAPASSHGTIAAWLPVKSLIKRSCLASTCFWKLQELSVAVCFRYSGQVRADMQELRPCPARTSHTHGWTSPPCTSRTGLHVRQSQLLSLAVQENPPLSSPALGLTSSCEAWEACAGGFQIRKSGVFSASLPGPPLC